ncbi:MAG: HAD hydrolase family protein [Cellvibrionaceae bacterium]|nr:HAD hydrolase family protein [Cellvibrionaceae bacterium]
MEIQQRAQKVKLLMLDVDGVLSDGRLYFSNDGNEFKAFSTLDGQGIKMLQASGVQVGIITGRQSQLVARRAENLGIKLLKQGREDKLIALQELLAEAELELELEQIAYMGDDYPDLPLIRRVGLGLAPANAHEVVADNAHWQSQRRGGEGAVREACDMIMRAQGNFDAALAPYL